MFLAEFGFSQTTYLKFIEDENTVFLAAYLIVPYYPYYMQVGWSFGGRIFFHDTNIRVLLRFFVSSIASLQLLSPF